MMCQVNQVTHLSNNFFCYVNLSRIKIIISLLIFCTIKSKEDSHLIRTSLSNPLKRWRKKEEQSYKLNNLLRLSSQYKHLSPKAMILLEKYLVQF